MNLLFDPVFLTTPSEASDQETIETWFHHLHMWLQEIHTPSPFTWYHARIFTQLLEAEGRFPSFHALKKWINTYEIDVNLTHLMTLLNHFFRDDTHDINGVVATMNVLFEREEMATRLYPTTLTTRWHPSICAEMSHLLVTMAVLKWLQYPFAQHFSLVTPSIENVNEIDISTSITTLMRDDVIYETSSFIHEKIPLITIRDDMPFDFDIVSLWSGGEQSICYAIEQSFKKSWQQTVSHPLPFHFGPYFLLSIRERHLETNGSVLAKIVRYAASLIARKAQEMNCDLHTFREDKAAESGQKIRYQDEAKAWRLMLTDAGAGWRLNYWYIPTPGGGQIEFSNVQKKNEPEKIY